MFVFDGSGKMVRLRWLLLCSLLTACAVPPGMPPGDGWHAVTLPGKAPTRYQPVTKDGREAIEAVADRSASLWRRHVRRAPERLGFVEFSWWVQALPPNGDVGSSAHEDAAARVLFAFDGDHDRLSPRNRLLFDLAQALTGERPPYATLMYVYDRSRPVGSVVTGTASDRVRKIVVDSGPADLQRWRFHRRDLAADFRLAFGEEPGELLSLAIMTDSDNTASNNRAWYGPVRWH